MKKIVEFKAHAGNIPYFIEQRMPLISGPKFIGITYDDKECYLPNTLVALTYSEAVQYIDTIQIIKEINEATGAVIYYESLEKQILMEQWLNSVI